MRIRALVRVGVSVGLLACSVPVLTQPAPGAPKCGRFGLDLTTRQAGVKPGDDFCTCANGACDARTEIAPDRSSAGVAATLVDETEAVIRGILDELAKNPAQHGASGRQIGDFYASWMDVEGNEARDGNRSSPISTASPLPQTGPQSRSCSLRLTMPRP